MLWKKVQEFYWVDGGHVGEKKRERNDMAMVSLGTLSNTVTKLGPGSQVEKKYLH